VNLERITFYFVGKCKLDSLRGVREMANVTITTDAPNTPTNVMVAPQVGIMNITWIGDDNATSYEVERRVDGGAYAGVATVATTSYEDIIGELDTSTYTYRISASNAGGTSGYSVEVSAEAIPKYIEQNIFVPAQYWNGDGINQEAKGLIAHRYSDAGHEQSIRTQQPYVCVRTYN
jgi:hypothetical protein